jgi:hypothetical protein
VYLLVLFIFSIALLPLFRLLKGRGARALSKFSDMLSLPLVVYALAIPIACLMVNLDPRNGLLGSRDMGGWPLLIFLLFFIYGFVVISHAGLQERIKPQCWFSLVPDASDLRLRHEAPDAQLDVPAPAQRSSAALLRAAPVDLDLRGICGRAEGYSSAGEVAHHRAAVVRHHRRVDRHHPPGQLAEVPVWHEAPAPIGSTGSGDLLAATGDRLKIVFSINSEAHRRSRDGVPR